MPYRVDLVSPPTPPFPTGDFPCIFAFKQDAEHCIRVVAERGGTATRRTVRTFEFSAREQRALDARPGARETSTVHPGLTPETVAFQQASVREG